MKLLFVITALFLSACTVRVTDSRLTREEVAAAFAQRDAALDTIVAEIKQIKKTLQQKDKQHEHKSR